MRGPDLAELLVLAAVWGASFLFLRVAAPEFGPVPLIALRVGIAAALLLPLLALRGGLGALRGRAGHLLAVGLLNSALPFVLLAYATLSISAGFASVLNATSPLWGGLVAHIWLRDRLDRSRSLGLLVGFGGVVFLSWGRVSFRSGGGGLAVLAVLAATLSYGVAASYTKRFLAGVNPLASAAGSQAGAALLLAPLAVVAWPVGRAIGQVAWAAVALLGVLCTAFAYILYFRLIARVGPARAIAVTFLIPAFAIAWGALLLGEAVPVRMLLGCAVVLLGTGLATGFIRLPRRPAAAGGPEPGSRGASDSGTT